VNDPKLLYSVDQAQVLNSRLGLVSIEFRNLGARVVSSMLTEDAEFGYVLTRHNVTWDLEEPMVRSVFWITVVMRQNLPGEQPSEFAKATAAAQVEYIVRDEPLSSDEVECVPHFLALNGWLHAWPYLRAEVQSLTAKMGIPPLTMPMLLAGQTLDVPVQRTGMPAGDLTPPPVNSET
jgi:hypothetical protein